MQPLSNMILTNCLLQVLLTLLERLIGYHLQLQCLKKWETQNLRGLQKLNVATKKDPYPLPFIDEVINIIIGHEVYTFLNGFSRYLQISIASETQYKIAFVIDQGGFVWIVMPFGVKSGCLLIKWQSTNLSLNTFDVFMKIFEDDFTIFNDLSTHF